RNARGTIAMPNAGNTTDLITDINNANAAGSGTVTIDITAGFTLTSGLPAIALQPGVSLVIEGGGNTLDGGTDVQGFAVFSGNVTLDNLTLADAVAQGATGDPAGGGGGAGLGGGLFVGSQATVHLKGVLFSHDGAHGGNGGTGGVGGAGEEGTL